MAIQRLTIKEFLEQSENALLLDVRSPAEYKHAHIPGAVSIPLFSDEERKIVGTTYKQQSREQAIKVGLDFFGPKMRGMVEEVEAIVRKLASSRVHELSETLQTTNDKPQTTNSVFVYCWRGGMRSAGVAWLLDLYGFKVCTLIGGYKTFRNHALQSFEQPFSFTILGGYTGSGKTEVLQQLKQLGEKVIDLEALACHKGSAFGSYNMPQQPSQEMFENKLSCELQAIREKKENAIDHFGNENSPSPLTTYHSPVFIEDESQRIGNLNIPNALWQTMRQSPVVFLDIDFEERLNHIVEEYGSCDKEKLIESVERISKRLGNLNTKKCIVDLEEGNIKEAFRILLQYYDKRYSKGLHNRESLSALLTTVVCERVTPANAQLLAKHQPV